PARTVISLTDTQSRWALGMVQNPFTRRRRLVPRAVRFLLFCRLMPMSQATAIRPATEVVEAGHLARRALDTILGVRRRGALPAEDLARGRVLAGSLVAFFLVSIFFTWQTWRT